MSVASFTKSGAKSTVAAKLDKQVFDVSVQDHSLLKQMYLAYEANGRENLAVTKTRGLVSGGGRKPWKQKGTGRARFGSSRVPIWRGGGITFGPTGEENYSKKTPVKAKRLAVKQALTLAAGSDKLRIVESLEIADGKTQTCAKLLNKIGAKGRTLIVVADKSDNLVRSVNNIQNTQLVSASYLNVYSIMNADTIVIESKALPVISEWLVESTTKTTTAKVEDK